MINKDNIKEIIDVAVNAPSGHNSQPWRFVAEGNAVFIYNIPDKDKTPFNWEQRGSLVAHGALIENIVIGAAEKELEASVSLFPQRQDSNLTAELNFKKNSGKYAYRYLFPHILGRTTNRKPYKVKPLESEDRSALAQFIQEAEKSGYRIILTENRDDIEHVAGPFSMGDRLIFENFYVHKALFDNVNWSLKEEQEKREGLYVRTKELSLLDRIILRYLLSNWNIVKRLERVKLSTKAAEKREKLYKRCSAIGIITAPDDFPEHFVESGRIVQRLWLTATCLGLSFQPVSVGLLYLGQKIQQEEANELTPNQVEFVKAAYEKIKNVFNISGETPVFSFRVGYASAPSASSLKKQPEIVFRE